MTREPDIEMVREMALKYRNWGRWGADDQLGSLNFVTDEMRAHATTLARRGTVFSLALPLDVNGPMVGAHGRVNPYHFMIWDGGDFEPGVQDFIPAMRYTDDAVRPIKGGTTADLANLTNGDGSKVTVNPNFGAPLSTTTVPLQSRQ